MVRLLLSPLIDSLFGPHESLVLKADEDSVKIVSFFSQGQEEKAFDKLSDFNFDLAFGLGDLDDSGVSFEILVGFDVRAEHPFGLVAGESGEDDFQAVFLGRFAVRVSDQSPDLRDLLFIFNV